MDKDQGVPNAPSHPSEWDPERLGFPPAPAVPLRERKPKPRVRDRLEKLEDEMTLAEAAKAAKVSHRTLREAIKAGEIQAWIPRGRDPNNTGPRLGYRINKRELIRWLYGEAAVPPAKP